MCTPWSVRDLVNHLIDTDIRRLSLQRDNLRLPPPKANSFAEVVDFINDINGLWVAAGQRFSPAVCITLHRTITQELHEFLKTVDPNAQALFAVGWAGQSSSPNWFDLAREYTEKWHHQQQVHLAVNGPGIMERRWSHPTIDTFMRGLPHFYRQAETAEGKTITCEITGEAADCWTIKGEDKKWKLWYGRPAKPDAHIRLSTDVAWRLFTKSIDISHAKEQIELVDGSDQDLAPLLAAVAIMAL